MRLFGQGIESVVRGGKEYGESLWTPNFVVKGGPEKGLHLHLESKTWQITGESGVG